MPTHHNLDRYHAQRRGKTPVLQADEARTLLDAIDTDSLPGLRDRALIGLMVYTFSRVGAAIAMRVEVIRQTSDWSRALPVSSPDRPRVVRKSGPLRSDPAQDGRMGQIESALGHHFDQIPEAELVAQVPAYAQNDQLTIEVPSCKQLLKAAQFAHHPSSASRKTTVPDGLFAPEPPMLGFKNFKSAAITIAGVELLRRIHKDQFALNRLRLKGQAAPAIWNAVLAA